jgi:hypothetical protein
MIGIPENLDHRLLLAVKNVIVVDLAGKVPTSLPVTVRANIEKVAAFPPAGWVRRIR